MARAHFTITTDGFVFEAPVCKRVMCVLSSNNGSDKDTMDGDEDASKILKHSQVTHVERKKKG